MYTRKAHETREAPGVARDDQPEAREGQAGRPGVAERFVVPRKPGNAGGGKGPQFKTDAMRGEGRGDWATYQLRKLFRSCRRRCTRKREVLSESRMREICLSGSMSVAPCKRVEVCRLRRRPRQSLASSREPSLAWRPVTAVAKRRQGGCRPERQ